MIGRSDSATIASSVCFALFSCRSPFSASERGGQDVIRGLEGYALRLRDRGRQRTQEWRAPVVDLPPEKHGVVLVHGVVAVLHEHPTPVAELQRDVNGAVGAQPPDVLAALLPGRDVRRFAVASQRLALLEVDVDRVVPTTAAVLQVPDLACTVAGRRRYPAEVGGESSSLLIRLDTPRTKEARHRVVGRLAGAG